MDSSGIVSIKPKDKMTQWQKLPVMGSFFIGDTFAKSLMSEANKTNTMTICHTRAATSGGVSISTAHPFGIEGPLRDDGTYRELVGVHNGTLQFWHNKKGAKDYTVDSEWALNHIFDNGMRAFEDIEGAFVFVWWDNETPDILNIALNEQRPMYVAFTDKEGMAFASEPGMLAWLCERNSIKLEGPITKLAADNWYKFDYTNLKNYTKEKLPAKKVPTYSQTSYQNTYKNEIQKMDELAKEFGTALVVPTGNGKRDKVTVKPTEIELARDMDIMNKRGTFQPMSTTSSGDVEGVVILDNKQEFNAIMRNGDWYKYDDKTYWNVSLIGVVDDGSTLLAVISQPFGITRETKRLSEQATT